VLNLKPGSALVIHNGMPVPRALAPSAPPSVSGGLRIGAVGRLAEQKGLHTLIEALRSLPQCRLTLVGEGPERAALEDLVHRYSLSDRVEFAGWASPPWTGTWSFDVLAMPSINEGFPLVIVEAMLASIPVVASTVGGIPEIVVPDSTGLLVPPGDPGALAQALRRLADDPQLRQDMGARCRSVALEQFTDKVMAARFEALYRELLSAGH
jgi:glycosyltransferase involved in cell wall biosynthesis